MNISAAVRREIDRYLSEVRRYLGRLPSEEREELIREVEAHTFEALDVRCTEDPTIDDIEAVLAEMDSPESYQPAEGEDPQMAPTYSGISRHHLNIPLYLVLTFITCGIFNLYWNYRQMEACNELLGQRRFSFWLWFLLCIVTCCLYHLVYQYMMGAAIVEIQKREGVSTFEQLPIVSVVVSALGIPFVVDAIHQFEINKLA